MINLRFQEDGDWEIRRLFSLSTFLTRSLVDVKMGLSNPRNQQQIESAPTYDANLGTTKFWIILKYWLDIQYWYIGLFLLNSFFSQPHPRTHIINIPSEGSIQWLESSTTMSSRLCNAKSGPLPIPKNQGPCMDTTFKSLFLSTFILVCQF